MTGASLHTDGGARPTNPGPAGFAAVVAISGQTHVLARPLGWRTNNQAEFTALIVGIKYASYLGAKQIDIFCDSKLVVEAVNQRWHIKDATIRLLCQDAIWQLGTYFPEAWTLTWVKREDNAIADEFCTKAIRSNNPWIPNLLDPFNQDHKKPHRNYNRNPYALQ